MLQPMLHFVIASLAMYVYNAFIRCGVNDALLIVLHSFVVTWFVTILCIYFHEIEKYQKNEIL